MEKRNTITTAINNQRVSISGENAFRPLAQYLRDELNLTGTKIVCAEGDCGACTVLIAKDVDCSGKLKFQSVNSCILPLYLIDGAQVVTVEGIGKSSEGKTEVELSPVQQKMIDKNGAQCGYCTPGFICAMAGMAETFKNEKKVISVKAVKNYLTGNLCRCTGYQPIIEAMMSVVLDDVESLHDRYYNTEWLKEMKMLQSQSVEIKLATQSLFLPTTVKEALAIKSNNSAVRIIAGSTDIGVVVNKGKLETPNVMSLYHIAELAEIKVEGQYLKVGATVTLSDFEYACETHFPEMAKMIHIFASHQIKNQATLIGNMVNASPIADTIPFLMVCDAIVVVQDESGTREIAIKDFYQGYRKIDLKNSEIVTAVKIPLLRVGEQLKLYKVSMRKDLDISAVTFAGRVMLDGHKIKDIKLAYGGVAATVIRLPQMEKELTAESFSNALFANKANDLKNYMTPLSDLRASSEYRLMVSKNYLKKFARELCQELGL